MGIHWYILIAFVIIYLQGVIYRRLGFTGLSYSRSFTERAVFAGEEVQMVEKIVNRKLLPLPWVRLESSIHAHLAFRQTDQMDISSGKLFQNHKSMFSLMPYTQITRRHTVQCTKRGWYFLDSVAVTYGNLVGAPSATRNIKLSLQLLVYPKPYPIESIPFSSHSWHGDIAVKRWIVEDPFIISGVREYRSGDPLHHINWKATARAGSLQVHRRDYTADHRLLIYLNFEVTEKMWDAVTDPDLIEKGVSYTASLAQYAISQGMETAFGCNGYTTDRPKEPVTATAANGADPLTAIYETLAKLEIARSVPFDTFLDMEAGIGRPNSHILIITAFVSEKMRDPIARLEKQGHQVTIIPLEHENKS
jgi:uncharacterized protein (DUF58 family)